MIVSTFRESIQGGSPSLSESLGNEDYYLEDNSLLPSLRLSGYFDSLDLRNNGKTNNDVSDTLNQNKAHSSVRSPSTHRHTISPPTLEHELDDLSSTNNTTTSSNILCRTIPDTNTWNKPSSGESSPNISLSSSSLLQSLPQSSNCSLKSASFDNLSILEKDPSHISSSKSPQKNTVPSSLSSIWHPTQIEDGGFTPQKTKSYHQPSEHYIDCDCCSMKHDLANTRQTSLDNNTNSHGLITHLTEQIISLNRWRETAILEAVEKDR